MAWCTSACNNLVRDHCEAVVKARLGPGRSANSPSAFRAALHEYLCQELETLSVANSEAPGVVLLCTALASFTDGTDGKIVAAAD